MFGETTIFYVKIWNHPTETTKKTWLFRVPGNFWSPSISRRWRWGFYVWIRVGAQSLGAAKWWKWCWFSERRLDISWHTMDPCKLDPMDPWKMVSTWMVLRWINLMHAKNNRIIWSLIKKKTWYKHSLKLTVCTWKMASQKERKSFQAWIFRWLC